MISKEQIEEKRKLQMQIIIKEADLKKILQKKTEEESAVRELEKKIKQLEFDITQKQTLIKKIVADAGVAEVEVKKLKNKLNLIK